MDYVKSLRDIYGLKEEWAKEGWSEREWKKVARKTELEVAGSALVHSDVPILFFLNLLASPS